MRLDGLDVEPLGVDADGEMTLLVTVPLRSTVRLWVATGMMRAALHTVNGAIRTMPLCFRYDAVTALRDAFQSRLDNAE